LVPADAEKAAVLLGIWPGSTSAWATTTFQRGLTLWSRVIGQRGSWNRSTLSGYKLIFVPFENGQRPPFGWLR
jgi:hypothetical protein